VTSFHPKERRVTYFILHLKYSYHNTIIPEYLVITMGNCFSNSTEQAVPPPKPAKEAKEKNPSSSSRPPSSSTKPKSSKSSKKKSSDGLVEGSSTGKHFNEVYKIGKQLGEGAFSVVKEGHNRQTGSSFAIKIVTKAKLSKEDEVALRDEIDVLKDMEHAHIIRLYDVFEEPANYYMVTEKMSGGELFDRIVQKSYYNEREARDTCLILLSAIHHCHSKKVAHRDLKPENLLLTSENDDSSIKIADFGFAKRVKAPKSLTTQCGTVSEGKNTILPVFSRFSVGLTQTFCDWCHDCLYFF